MLEEQAATYSPTNKPLKLQNDIKATKEAIVEIDPLPQLPGDGGPRVPMVMTDVETSVGACEEGIVDGEY